jgi:hypothetical protein
VLRTDPTFGVTSRHTVFSQTRLFAFTSHAQYDVHPDGDRFLLIDAEDQEAPQEPSVVVVVNWFEELKARMSQGGAGAERP